MNEVLPSMEELLSRAYQQGKAEAIDRCIEIIKKSFPSEESTFASLIIWEFEQLKAEIGV